MARLHLLLFCCLLGGATADITQRRAVVPLAGARRLPALRGGGSTGSTAVVATTGPPMKSGGWSQLKLYSFCGAIIVTWISLSTVFYAINEKWPYAQSLFYAVDTGMSIGFGAVAEQKLSSKLFTIFHVLLGASACGGALALFAESAVDGSNSIAEAEYVQATLRAAFARADTDDSGHLSADEFAAVLTQCGLELSKEELKQAGQVFDPDGDGAITVEEFMSAVGPFVSSSVPVTASIRMAMARRTAPLHARLFVALRDFVLAQKTLLLWALWVGAGAVWGSIAEGWDPITAVYFAVGGLGTGGLEAPSLTAEGTIPGKNAVFVGLWCLTGIPIFAMARQLALGSYASVFVNKILAAKERRAIKRAITMEEFDFAMGLFHQDGKLDLSEFIALELLRLGKVEMGTLDSIRREFDLMDKDRDGSLTAKEVMAHKGGGVVPPKRGKRGSKKA